VRIWADGYLERLDTIREGVVPLRPKAQEGGVDTRLQSKRRVCSAVS
jgi:hypothetical protein